MPARKSSRPRPRFPSTTVIGSYPVLATQSLIDQYKISSEDLEDPIESTIQLSVRDFLSAGIEYPCTGQTRDSFVRLFLDPEHIEGIKKNGSEIVVSGKLRRKSSIRMQDVQVAKRLVPRYYGFKEPVTDPYTLARNCRIEGSVY